MQYRDYKEFAINNYYHVFNRGVAKQKVFIDHEDYEQFLLRLKIVLNLIKGETNIKPLAPESFSILAYCLMPNHFHIFLRQNSKIGVSKLILKLCTSYSIYFNKKYNRVGSLFQDTFKAKLITDDEYALYLSAYIHNNVENPENYPYSSFKEILLGKDNSLCDIEKLLAWFDDSVDTYKEFVASFKHLKNNFEEKFISDLVRG